MDNATRLDPTRSLTERRAYAIGLRKVFKRLADAVTALLDRELIANSRWGYKTNEQAADEFEAWLETRVQAELMSPSEAARMRRYLKRGFEKGAARAFHDVNKLRRRNKQLVTLPDARAVGVESRREAFMRSAMQRAVALEKLTAVQSQALAEVRGMSQELVAKGRRSLVDSLVRGLTPQETAERLRRTLKVSLGRAETIAFTELTRAHAEGQLEAMEQLGVERVGAAVEWSTTGKPCPLCAPLDGVVLKPSEARGMLPRHPRCKCAWLPANIGEERRKQIRGKYRIDKAVEQSAKRGGDDFDTAKPVSRKRPTLNCECHDLFSVLLAKLEGR